MPLWLVNVLAIQLAIGVTQDQSSTEAILTDQNCPNCARGEWICQQPDCSPGTPVNGHIFNFEYYNEGCTEEVPATETSINIDHDMWCIGAKMGNTELRERLTCQNMNMVGFDGVSAFKQCSAVGNANLLLQEKCDWTCKMERPAIRCVYTFDITGEFSLRDGKVDYCFVSGVCTSNSEERRKILCKREDYLKDLETAKANRDKVKALKNSTTVMSKDEQRLIKANKGQISTLQAKLKDQAEKLSKAKTNAKKYKTTLAKEREAHAKTKGKMEGKEEQWSYQRAYLLFLLFIAMVSLAVVVYFGIRFYRNWVAKMQLPVPTAEDYPTGQQEFTGDGTVVYGRPVQLRDAAKADVMAVGTVSPPKV